MRFAAVLPDSGDVSVSQQRLLDCARLRGHSVEVWPVPELAWGADKDGLRFSLRGGPLPPADIIYWWLPHGEKAGQALVEAMESAGLPMFPSPFIPFSDKVTQARRLGAAGVPVPETLVMTAAELAARPGGMVWPRVLKNPHSSRGQGVFWVETATDVAGVIAEARLAEDALVVVQQPVEPLGEDVRVFMIGEKIIAAMVRRAAAGDFRANVSQGGIGLPTTLTPEEERIALAAWRAMGHAPRAGVDFIRSADGPVVLEVNLWPGFVGLETATGLGIAALQVESMEAFVRSRG